MSDTVLRLIGVTQQYGTGATAVSATRRTAIA